MDKFKNHIFLLGGHDLEMLEIRKILESNNLTFYDHQLEWGAKLSSYSGRFNDSSVFVGIELITDIPLPAHYIEIDHHNEKRHLPSSIEQLADLLGIELDRRQLLIAANDKGYIPAMNEADATEQEIITIRLEDRRAQGVTEEDERLAELSIQNNLVKYHDLIIVEALTAKFSAICDRLYPIERLLIFSKEEVIFYGKGVKQVVSHFLNLMKLKIAFTGGGDNGFWGTVTGKQTQKEILNIVTDIKTFHFEN